MKSITFVLRPFDGVAYTTSCDSGAYEVHYSLDWIEASKARARDEIFGVLVHEVVHCYQYNAKGTCPGGLIEGIAGTHNNPALRIVLRTPDRFCETAYWFRPTALETKSCEEMGCWIRCHGVFPRLDREALW